MPLSQPTLTLRLATAADAADLARVAELDSARPLAGPALVAEVDGEIVAAVSLADRTVIADPFRPTADLVDALRGRAHHLAPQAPVRRRARRAPWLRPRTA